MFEIWKDSIYSRFYIEASLLVFFTAYLQYMMLLFVENFGKWNHFDSD